MSVHDEGYGDNARPTLEFESDFANRFRSVGAEGDQSWGAPAHAAHRSEEPFMTSGAGRPGQPGQRSIFGTGRGPVFAQMPAYKPVTRGPEPQPQHLPEPPQPDYGSYARQGAEPQSPQMPGVSGYAEPEWRSAILPNSKRPAAKLHRPRFPKSLPAADLSTRAAAAELPASAASPAAGPPKPNLSWAELPAASPGPAEPSGSDAAERPAGAGLPA